MMPAPNTLLNITGLTKYFPLKSGWLRRTHQFAYALDGIDLTIARGERIGLIGATGAGKSVLGKLLLRLIEPSAGTLVLHAKNQRVDVTRLRGQHLKVYWQHVQMLFPHARESLDPRYTVFDAVAEPLHTFDLARPGLPVRGFDNPPRATTERVSEMLHWVGLAPSRDFLFLRPGQLSDAQIHRVTLARALIARPALIVADDPFAQVDASLRAGLLRALRRVLQHMHVSLVYLTRDPATAHYLCDRIGVMLHGKIIELGASESVLQTPAHPYTRAWLSALSHIDLNASDEIALLDDASAHSIDPHPRCRFYDQCKFANALCRDATHPPLEEKRLGHLVACYQIAA